MKKVLVICDLFPPAFGPRMGYLCKYLKHYNWEPVILTEAVEEKTFTFLAGKDKVTYVNYYTAQNPVLKKLQWISTLFLTCVSAIKIPVCIMLQRNWSKEIRST